MTLRLCLQNVKQTQAGPSISQGGLDLRLEQAIDFLPGDRPAF
jgi:hypothetical protein